MLDNEARNLVKRWLQLSPKRCATPQLVSQTLRDIKSGRLTSLIGARTWFHTLPPELQDEAAWFALRKVAAEISMGLSAESREKIRDAMSDRRIRQETTATALKAIAKRVIEILDSRQINGKSLGDCRRPDLLKEAYRLDELAGEATLDAAFYRAMAELIGDQTVRGFEGRDKVLALLTSRFST